MQASPELNKFNIYLKKAAEEGYLYAKFEEYVAKLLFEVPLPLNNTILKVYLPPGNDDGVSKQNVVEISEPKLFDKLVYVDNRAIQKLFSTL